MIDHIGFPVSDYARARAFYTEALAPLGYGIVMEVTQEQTGHAPAAGFGADGKPDFWIGGEGGEGGSNKPLHVAILAKDRATIDAFYRAAIGAGDLTVRGLVPLAESLGAVMERAEGYVARRVRGNASMENGG